MERKSLVSCFLDTCSQFCFINKGDDYSTLYTTLSLKHIEEKLTTSVM